MPKKNSSCFLTCDFSSQLYGIVCPSSSNPAIAYIQKYFFSLRGRQCSIKNCHTWEITSRGTFLGLLGKEFPVWAVKTVL